MLGHREQDLPDDRDRRAIIDRVGEASVLVASFVHYLQAGTFFAVSKLRAKQRARGGGRNGRPTTDAYMVRQRPTDGNPRRVVRTLRPCSGYVTLGWTGGSVGCLG